MTVVGLPPVVAATPVRVHLMRRVLRRPLGLISLLFLAFILTIAIIGPSIAPQDPNYKDIRAIRQPPSADHLLGTDGAGRDVLSRLLDATQTTIAAALLAIVVALVIGVVAGLIAGYYKGWFDNLASWVTDLNMALPGIVLLLAVRAVVGPSIWIAMIVVGVLLSPSFFRLVRAAVVAVRGELYVDAARVSGLSDGRIIGRHVLSVVRAPIIIQTAIVAGLAIALQSGIEFLGLGDVNVPTWGSMLDDGFRNVYATPLLMLWPSLALGLTCIALVLLGNIMRDELERTTKAVRRRRAPQRQVVKTSTGTLEAVTTTVRTPKRPSRRRAALTDDSDATRSPTSAPEEVHVHPGTIVHDDDSFTSRADEPILVLRDVGVGYDQQDGTRRDVVQGVSLEVRRGEVHGLIGESGSGKTQTAFAVLGLLSPGGRVVSGSMEFEGVELAGADDSLYSAIRGKRIGYVPQEPSSNLDPSFTIGSQLVEPLRHVGMTKKQATNAAKDLLARVGIVDPHRTFAAYPHEVSGGMAQRVLIAGAVSLGPDLIIADEPTTALDVTLQAEILDLLRSLQEERNMAMLLVTHNFGVVADLCDRATVMQNGRFVEQGPVRAIFHDAQHPYTQALLGAILDGGPARPTLVPVGSGAGQ